MGFVQVLMGGLQSEVENDFKRSLWKTDLCMFYHFPETSNLHSVNHYRCICMTSANGDPIKY